MLRDAIISFIFLLKTFFDDSLVTHIPGVCFVLAAIVLVYYFRRIKNADTPFPDKAIMSAKCRKRLYSPLVKIGQVILVGLFILNFTSLDREIVYRLEQ